MCQTAGCNYLYCPEEPLSTLRKKCMIGNTKGVGLQRQTEPGIAGDSCKIKRMFDLVFDAQQVLQEFIKKFKSRTLLKSMQMTFVAKQVKH